MVNKFLLKIIIIVTRVCVNSSIQVCAVLSFDHTSDHLLTTLHTVVNTTKQIVRDSDSMDKISLSFIFILVVFFSDSPTVNNKSELRTLS